VNRARRHQFVECAIESLVELGFAGTTIAEVARRAGVSKSVVLYHFSSRTELMLAVVTQVYEDATPQAQAVIRAAAPGRDRVLSYVRMTVQFAWTHQREAKAVLEVARNLRDENGRPWETFEGNNRLVARTRELLEEAQRDGALADFDSWTLAVLLRATIDALSEQFMADPSVDGAQVAEHLVRLVDRMICPPAARDHDE
jgi:TetR/AcrR family transcriptional regulator, fatty acid metabolism regulator protein